MHPVLFEIPGLGFPIRSFGVMLVAGFLLGLQIWSALARRFGDDPEQDPMLVSQVAVWLLVGVVAGGRLMYVAVELLRYLALEEPTGNEVGARYLADPFTIFAVWEGGLVMYGGFFGAMLLGLLKARGVGLKPLNALDTGLTAGFVGQAIGRVGCLLVGDDYGSVVAERYREWPFPLVIRVPKLEWLQNNPESLFDHSLAGKSLWATQPWMSVNALVIAAAGYWLLKRRRYYGQVSQWIILHYALTRFGIEFFRGDGIRGMWFGGHLSTSQLISLPVAALALFLLLRNRTRRDAIALSGQAP